MAAPLVLKTAIGTYPHTRPLKDGRVASPRLCLEHVEGANLVDMLRRGEIDAAAGIDLAQYVGALRV